MSKPRALVLRTAGINCDGETVAALELAGAGTDLVHLSRVLAEPARLDEYALVVIPGGFSYGDDIAAGRVFGLELRTRLAHEMRAFVARGGFILGVCNGFQVLLEAGLFETAPQSGHESSEAHSRRSATEPRTTGARTTDAHARSIALYNNASNHFECRWITLEEQACAASWLAAGERMPAPVAHGEGRFVVRDDATLQRLISRRQIALRYVREDGSAALGFPYNPNGSVYDIAGISDPTGRVLGLMPHPERNLMPWSHPQWTRRAQRTTGEGQGFYRRLVDAAQDAHARAAVPVPSGTSRVERWTRNT